MKDADRNQAVREAALEFLVARPTLVYTVADIVERLQRSNLLDFRPEADEVTAAVAFLENLKLIASKRAPLGRTLYFQATSAGVLAHERGTLEDS